MSDNGNGILSDKISGDDGNGIPPTEMTEDNEIPSDNKMSDDKGNEIPPAKTSDDDGNGIPPAEKVDPSAAVNDFVSGLGPQRSYPFLFQTQNPFFTSDGNGNPFLFPRKKQPVESHPENEKLKQMRKKKEKNEMRKKKQANVKATFVVTEQEYDVDKVLESLGEVNINNNNNNINNKCKKCKKPAKK